MKPTNNFALIMAGGVGSRFWPTSRSNYPKQFQDLMGVGRTLLQQTFDRLSGLIPPHQVYVLTHASYRDLVLEQLPMLEKEQVICEPAMRNTAPCILYAALKINQRNPQACMLVMPSDHFISDLDAFRDNVHTALEKAASENCLLTFGIPPNSPHTGYGYLAVSDKNAAVSSIHQFTEKPSLEKAKSFLAAGNYFWNAGIFVWSCQSICTAFSTHQPQMLALFTAGVAAMDTQEEDAFLHENYPKAENISIDYAILEKAENIFAVKATFIWNDLGTWTSLHEQLAEENQQNISVKAKAIVEESSGNMIYSANNKVVVIKGLHDFVVVDEKEVLMLYPKGQDQEVRELRKKTLDEFGDQLA